MAISFASSRFTVTGGKISGTATSATSNTLTATGLFTGYTSDTLTDRVVWIHTGTGDYVSKTFGYDGSGNLITVTVS